VYSAKEDGEWALLMKLSEYPAIIQDAAEKKKPHLLAGYLRDLASAFNDFYRDYPVLNAKERDARLTLTESFMKVMEKGMDALGIRVLERM
jgi:arginyl-tRNA synthetase